MKCKYDTREKCTEQCKYSQKWRNNMEEKQYCFTCQWYALDEGICCNGESEQKLRRYM